MDIDNKMERIVSAYDFDSHLGSWFDMWHTHLDWNGSSTDDVSARQSHFLQTIQTFDTFCGKMEQRGKPYQAWILVDLSDSSEDAIYIHSPDPQGDSPFPFRIPLVEQSADSDNPVSTFFMERGFAWYLQPDFDDMYFFARPGVGTPMAELGEQ